MVRAGVICLFLSLVVVGHCWNEEDLAEESSALRALLLKHKRSQCDIHGRGWLGLEDLFRVCPTLSDGELRYIFDQLDVDKDGRIVREEFMNGFETVVASGEKSGYKGLSKRASISRPPGRPLMPTSALKPEITYNFEPESASLEQLPCQEDVLNLYSQLQASGVPQVLTQFEKIIGNFCKEMKEQKEQNERLQTVYLKEKEEYSKHMTDVEIELDQQVIEAEERARKAERARLEREKEDMRSRLEGEITELQQNIKKLQKMETVIAGNSDRAQKINDMKNQLQELMSENRRLKSNVTDKQTELAIIKAEFANLRQEYNEKCEDLDSEKQALVSYVSDKDNLTRQLQLLYDANTKLHDTNDSLRIAVDSRKAFCKKNNLDFQRSSSPISPASSLTRQSSISSVGSYGRRHTPTRPHRLRVAAANWHLRDNNNSEETDDDIDSGLARGSDTGSAEDSQDFNTPRPQPINNESDISGPEDDDLASDPIFERRSSGRRSGKSGQWKVRNSSASSAATIKEAGDPHQIKSERKPGLLRHQSSEPTGPPERTFRVVLAGDASVGKSSLIMRLVKDKFVGNLQSTLGVDFQVKALNVDGKNVAIQLWDTAGQERFRSLCKSYFRRADGAILVYDCTCERSFLNVRNWVETIQESVPRKIPVLLCANKVDMRISATADGKRVVSEDEGQKLAKVFSAIYMETSAKEGTNVKPAAVEMARELLAFEDCEVGSTSVVLTTLPGKKGSCCK